MVTADGIIGGGDAGRYDVARIRRVRCASEWGVRKGKRGGTRGNEVLQGWSTESGWEQALTPGSTHNVCEFETLTNWRPT